MCEKLSLDLIMGFLLGVRDTNSMGKTNSA